MIPLRDINPTRTTPIVTWGIVGLNVLVFLLTLGDIEGAARAFGAVAYHITGLQPEVPYGYEPVPADGLWPIDVFTHMWLHGGLLHLAGNMWFLWIFGDNVEERLGSLRFAAFYLICGLIALTAQVASDPAAGVPMVGASGALSGVLGAYLRFFPHARVLGLVPLGILMYMVVWPAAAFLGVWILLQVVQALFTSTVGGGVAWFAHIGGFAAGWLLAPLFAPAKREVRVEVERPGYGDVRRRDYRGPF